MTDIPIIFSAPMVRALLDGRKTMTRRLAWGKQFCISDEALYPLGRHKGWRDDGEGFYTRPSPWQKVKPGARLWVRENFAAPFRRTETSTGCIYRADGAPFNLPSDRNFHTWDDSQKWTPSIHMPRWASRLTLVVTATKIERLQDISESDALAEGIYAHDTPDFGRLYSFEIAGEIGIRCRTSVIAKPSGHSKATHAFFRLWELLHGRENWDANPEVVALAFTVHKTNIDAMKAAA